MSDEQQYIHICEACGKTETLTPEAAFQDGWDYPPRMGEFGVVSPRTCGSCGIDTTLWWRMIAGHKDLTDDEKVVLDRILTEPASITP